MDDSLIIELFRKQDTSAVKEAERKYGKLLLKLAMGILCSNEEAEEVLNDTLLVAWDNIKISPPENLSAYLCKITRNIALKKYRYSKAKKRNSEYTLSIEEIGDIFPSDESPENTYSYEETKEAVFRFIRSLDEQSRKIFLRRYWYFDSVKDIARTFSLSESNVKTSLFRIKQNLKKYLKEEGVDI